MKRYILSALLAASVPAAALAQAAEEAPPVTEPEQGSLEVAPPPAPGAPKAPEGSGEVYVVKPGDTLWDLSQKFLGNPWYWPKVWSYNPEIENPHWIYPGNQVRFYPSQDEMPAQVEAGPAPAEEAALQPPAEMGDVSAGTLAAPDLMGQDEDVVAIAPGTKIGFTPATRSIIRQDGLITQRELDESGVIERAWAEKEMLSTYDKVYLHFRNVSQVRVGEKYSIFRTMGEVIHPVKKERFGFMTKVVGTLRIVSIDGKVVSGLIDHTIEPIHRADFVGPLGNFNKQVVPKENTRNVKGWVLATLVPLQPIFGEQHVVFIDKGSKDGVEEGNTFSVLRRGDPLYDNDDPTVFPVEDVATILIIDVKENASTGLVTRSIRELTLGDRVEMRVGRRASAQ
jgi:hypothetical protein